MNNLRLLAGLLVATLLSGGVCAKGQIDSLPMRNIQIGKVMSIEDLFSIAETNSAQLRPAFTAENEARREVSVARSHRLPDIDAAMSLSYIGDGFTTRRNLTDYQKAPIPHFGSGLSLNISQPVYAGGAISAGINLAELKSTATRFATELQRDNLRFRLTGFYLDIYKYSNLRKVVENNIMQARKVLADMTARYEQGLALQNDITRYELLVSNLGLELIKIDNTLSILNRNLAVIAGLPEHTIIEPDTTILLRSLPIDNEAYWQQTALDNSPALNLARSEVSINLGAERIVKSDRLPKIGLKAGWSMDGPILVEIPPINRNLSYWYVGVGISYNISSLYKSNKSLAKSRESTRRAMEEYDAAKDNVTLDVRSAYIRYLEAYEELKTREKSVELAERNYRTVFTRYSSDMALLTDMLDAANSRLEAQQCLVNARIDIIYNYYKLLFIAGKI